MKTYSKGCTKIETEIVYIDDLEPVPWKNGGGVTRELCRYPKESSLEDFIWRISVAEIEKSSIFSVFPGVDRVITLLRGEPIELRGEKIKAVLLPLLEPYSFCGEAIISANVRGVCQDFNLMLRRGAASGKVSLLKGDRNLLEVTNPTLLFCVQGKWTVEKTSRSMTLESGQALIFENKVGVASLHPLVANSILIEVNIDPLCGDFADEKSRK